ncbi:hypothetical protein CWB99_19135 [Pseudoalteromonas rubra]|uniref:Uncharacterized protein n=1 Tax=Pseudoalteromonas rubra TaxID=43658 RepID=A0A5S3WI79_9GAMM|nr:hypothetical protein [Pseudoalteromonas rubra]TMP26419.1 hypothetical protein CWB99_19135 [Pseudoalteromonas rubra]TMP29712.1 hypothetical protein CWC00_18685 [Pseudoalteromonas rubra]
MSASSDNSAKQHHSVSVGAQLKGLLREGKSVTTSYVDVTRACTALLKAKLRAHFKTILACIILMMISALLITATWLSLQGLIAYAMIQAGLSWFVSAGLLMALNLTLIYYLIATAIQLFDKTTSDLLDVY